MARLVIGTGLTPEEVELMLLTRECDIMYMPPAGYHQVSLPLTANIAAEVDQAVCQANSVHIEKLPGLKTVVFSDKGSIGLWVVQEAAYVPTKQLMSSLLQLAIGDACLGLGISSGSISLPSNDVLINGKKITGIEVYSRRYSHCGALFCNLELDAELAEAVLRGKVEASEITSISAELGTTVPEATFRSLLFDSISRRFNLVIYQ